MSLSPSERSLRARKAALTRWSRTSTADASAQASQRIHDRFLSLVDPDGTLDEAERTRRADQAKRAHFAGLALKSAQARRKSAGDAA